MFKANDVKIIKDLRLEKPLQEWNDWDLDFFDREGYQLNKIEKAYHAVNDVNIHTEDSNHSRKLKILDFGCGVGELVQAGLDKSLNIRGADTFEGYYENWQTNIPEEIKNRIFKIPRPALSFS